MLTKEQDDALDAINSLIKMAAQPRERKIVQIAYAPADARPGHSMPGCLIALCNDGSLWRISSENCAGPESWMQLPALPKPKIALQWELLQGGVLKMTYAQDERAKMLSEIKFLLEAKSNDGTPTFPPGTFSITEYTVRDGVRKLEATLTASEVLTLNEEPTVSKSC